MRQKLSVAFLASLLMAAPAALAQHGGGHAGSFAGGGHAGGFGGGGFSGHTFGGGFSGHSFGGSFVGSPGRMPGGFGPHSFSGAPRMAWTAPGRSFGTGFGRTRDGDRDGFSHDRDRFHDRSPYRGYGYGGYGGYPYPYYGNSWEILPWDLGDPDFTGYNSYDGYDGDSGPAQPEADAASSSGEAVAPPEEGYRPEYQGPAYAMQAAPPAAPIAPEPQLTLIFKDGHQQPIHNYVLTRNTVIVLDQAAAGRQQRVPLDELNLPATEQSAQQAGLDFAPPA